MARRTKKVGISGKYGPRYGVRIRKRIRDVEAAKIGKYVCPRCAYKAVKRLSTGVWRCMRCGVTIAGGAYIPIFEEKVKIEEKVEEG
jgi:large subunit ribosomal protein L37Ae